MLCARARTGSFSGWGALLEGGARVSSRERTKNRARAPHTQTSAAIGSETPCRQRCEQNESAERSPRSE